MSAPSTLKPVRPVHRDEPVPGVRRIERGVIYLVICGIIITIIAFKIATLENFTNSPVFATYSMVVAMFILSRFGFAWLYRPKFVPDAEFYRPTVAIIVPAYNEEAGITATLRACLSAAYPAELLRVVVVDDCSTDGTLVRIREFQKDHPELAVVASPVNRGKRHAMARGIEVAGDAEILVFIDSDSKIRTDAIRRLVRYFANPEIGAVAGHTDVWNKDANILTRMQAMQYYIAFRVYKSAEALFSSVTCCSGCFSGYRRSAVAPILGGWVNQRFFGQPSTYGDDRSLTNFLLPNWRIVYAPDAQAHTMVPERVGVFLRQQLRWKKSWLRESLRAVKIMWRRHPVMALGYYLSIVLPLIAPQIVFRAFVVQPHFLGILPIWYLGGVAAIALFYGLYYRLHQRDKHWYQGIFFTLFYTVLLVWQLPYALATVRDSKWGTR